MRTDGQVSTAVAPVITSDDMDVEALRAELAKWQERVPRLASALRERAEELNSLREQLRQANSSAASDAVPSILARDQLIVELQQQVEALKEKHRVVSAELHTANLDLQEVRLDASGWQERWQSVTSSLDDAVSDATRQRNEFEQHKQHWQAERQSLIGEYSQQLEGASRDAESLKVRNANLAETTEFANQQIESLSKELSRLVERDDQQQAQLKQVQEECERLEDAQAELETRLCEEDERYVQAMQVAEHEQRQLVEMLDLKDQAIAELQDQQKALELQQQQGAERQAEKKRLQSENQTRADEMADLAAQHEQRACELTGEVERLNDCIEQAQHSHDQLEQERRALAEKVAILQQALPDAQRSADKFKEYANGLEDRLESYKSLMSDLEEELTDVQVLRNSDSKKFDQQLRDADGVLSKTRKELAAERDARVNQQHAVCTLEDELYLLKHELDEMRWPQPDDASSTACEPDSADIPARLLELEQMLRERTEELDNLRWRTEQQSKPAAAGDNLIMILHQQLQDLREENRRLQEKLSKSKSLADLTVLKGVGAKVAEQLAGLGYGTLEAIARLEISDLDCDDHPLHGFKSRIARDEWIRHAKEFLED